VDIAGPGVDVMSTVAATTLETFTVFSEGTSYQFDADQVRNTTWGNVTGDILNMAAGCYSSSFDGVDATSKILYCRLDTLTQNGLQAAEEAGAAAIVLSNSGESGTGNWRLSNGRNIPVASFPEADGDIVEGLTTAWGNLELFETLPSVTSGYDSYQGTSMATPHVSAVAALVWAANPGAGAHLVRQCLEDTALDLGTAGRDNAFGYGLVQADAAHACVISGNTANPTPSPTIRAPTTADSVPTMSPTQSPIPVYHEVCVDVVGPIDSETVGDESQTATFNIDESTASNIEAMSEMHFFVSTRINHTYMSDLTATLHHHNVSVIVLDEECGAQSDLSVIISNDAIHNVEEYCLQADHSYENMYEVISANDLSEILAESIAGEWNITFTDQYSGDKGVIRRTCIGWRFGSAQNDDSGAAVKIMYRLILAVAGIVGLLMN
jgi:subtilisin-like proprotein convertase family protein